MARNTLRGAERHAPLSKRNLTRLYLEDETAWLELMSQLIRDRRFDEVDYKNLREYLSDMALRDRREVLSRLTTLLAHRLKWDYQPRKRSKSWVLTMLEQQHELEDMFQSKTLRNHGQDVLPKAYTRAVRLAASETNLAVDKFPQECPYTLDDLLSTEWKPQHD